MRRLGISIYPEKSDKQTILNYIDQAAKAGFNVSSLAFYP